MGSVLSISMNMTLTLASGGGGGGGGSSAAAPSLAEGIVYAHVSSAQQKPTVKEADKVGDGASLDLESLMAQLKGVQK